MKLTIELVPQTSFYQNVRKAVSIDEWRKIRTKSYKLAGYKCEICKGVGPNHPVEAHEVWSYDDKTKTQKLIGIISLCPDCHSVKHIGLALVRGEATFNRAFNHFCKINDLSLDEGTRLIKEAFNEHNRRSKYQWKVDISFLKNY